MNPGIRGPPGTKFTPNQEARLKECATPAAKKALTVQYIKQDRQNKQYGPITYQQHVARQRAAVPKTPKKKKQPNLTAGIPRGINSYNAKRSPHAFNAFIQRHLPLDEHTSSYSVTNFQTPFEVVAKADKGQVVIIAPRAADMVLGKNLKSAAWQPPGQVDGTASVGESLLTYVPGLQYTDFLAAVYDDDMPYGYHTTPTQTVRGPVGGNLPLSDQVTPADIRLRLHNLSVSVTCLGTSTGLVPPGEIYMGTVPLIDPPDTAGQVIIGGGVIQSNLKYLEALVDPAIAVQMLKPKPAAMLVNKEYLVHSAVTEQVAYKAWGRLCNMRNEDTPQIMCNYMNSLEPIVLYIPKGGTAAASAIYKINIGQEWCSRHPMNPIMRATQKQYPATKPDTYHAATQELLSSLKQGFSSAANSAGNKLGGLAAEALFAGKYL